ncbi:MAG: LacI family DNA-binding transcriptional regulator [Flavobacteriales bacterium]
MKPMTIKDLANFLNVSPSTVSRALNNHPDISIEVRQRVQQLAEELQFKPNSFAANFRKKQSKIIAVILPKIYRSFIPDVIEGITKKLNSHQYQTLMLITEDELDNEIAAIKQCCDMRVDGILLSLSNQTKNLAHLDLCKKLNIPLVLFDNTLESNTFPTVHINDAAAAATCAKYLNEKKVKRVAAVFGPEELNISRHRKFGFQNALDPSIQMDVCYAKDANAAYHFAMDQIQNKQTSAFFGISDEVLLGIITAIKENKLSKKTEVIGFSDGLTMPFLHKQLRYIFHDGKIVGQHAADLILRCMEDNQVDAPDVEISVELFGITV